MQQLYPGPNQVNLSPNVFMYGNTFQNSNERNNLNADNIIFQTSNLNSTWNNTSTAPQSLSNGVFRSITRSGPSQNYMISSDQIPHQLRQSDTLQNRNNDDVSGIVLNQFSLSDYRSKNGQFNSALQHNEQLTSLNTIIAPSSTESFYSGICNNRSAGSSQANFSNHMSSQRQLNINMRPAITPHGISQYPSNSYQRSLVLASRSTQPISNPYLRYNPPIGLKSDLRRDKILSLQSATIETTSDILNGIDQKDTAESLLVQRMAEAQISGELTQPRWIHYPHAADTLLPKHNAFYLTSSHNLFFQQPNTAIASSEKDIHKMLINRFRLSSLNVESTVTGKEEEDFKSFAEDRYLSANPIENVTLILLSSAPNNHRPHTVDQKVCLPCWHGISGGRYRSVCYRAYDTLDETLVHVIPSVHCCIYVCCVCVCVCAVECVRSVIYGDCVCDLCVNSPRKVRLILDGAGADHSMLAGGAFSCQPLCSAGQENVWSVQLRGLHQSLRELQERQRAAVLVVKDVFLCDAFQTKAVGLVTDFQPGCSTLLASHFSDAAKARKYQQLVQLDPAVALTSVQSMREDFPLMKPKRLLDYLVQMASILSSMHALGLAYGILEPSKVLIQEGRRIIFGSVGAHRLLLLARAASNEGKDSGAAEKSDFLKDQSLNMSQDLYDLGRLLLALSFGAVAAFKSLSSAADSVRSSPSSLGGLVHPNMLLCLRVNYGEDVIGLIVGLLDGSLATVDELKLRLVHQSFQALQETQNQLFYLEKYAMKEVLNGRLFRLLTKLNMCCDRTAAGDETSDLLVLRLFLNFVFHQQLSSGHAFIDLGHVVTSLTKLEGGSTDRISLVGLTGHIMLLNYAEILNVLNREFDRLKQSFQVGVMEKAAQNVQ